MSAPTLARSAAALATTMREVRHPNGRGGFVFTSLALPRPIELDSIGEVAAALHLSGGDVTAATTRREAAELVVRALVSLGIGAVRAVDLAARGRIGEQPWSRSRGQACADVAYRLCTVPWTDLPAPGTSRSIDLD